MPPISSADHHQHEHISGHSHAGHSHGPASPHPAQPAPWSILRMTMLARLGGAVALGAMLWAIVLGAMR